jgi:hypothetical protein
MSRRRRRGPLRARPCAFPLLPLPRRAQLWGAALPTNSPGVPCILDPAARVGVCGDWLVDPSAGGAAASMQAAALSGLALAERLCALRGADGGARDALAVGLSEAFAPLANPDIGGFPGEKAAAAAAAEAEAAGGAAAAGAGARRGGSNGGGRGGGARPERRPAPQLLRQPAGVQQ